MERRPARSLSTTAQRLSEQQRSAAGVATYTTTAFQLSLGSGHSITAAYGGDVNFTTSTSTALSQTVNQDSTTTSVASSTNPSVYGQSVTFTATVSANAPRQRNADRHRHVLCRLDVAGNGHVEWRNMPVHDIVAACGR